MSFSEICARYKNIPVPFKTIYLVCSQYKKMVPFKKISWQMMYGLPYKSFL